MRCILVGDVHGCWPQLQHLLVELAFDPDRDQLWSLGDWIGKGPDSWALLRFARQLGPAFRMVLGNHELRLLRLMAGGQDDSDPQLLSLLPALEGFDWSASMLGYRLCKGWAFDRSGVQLLWLAQHHG